MLETAPWNEDAGMLDDRKAEPRLLNWSFVVSGEPPADPRSASLGLARWLAAGGRGCILPAGAGPSTELSEAARWFGLRTMTRAEGERFRPPAKWSGDPAAVLPRWTTEAARAFRLSGRGRISQGAAADLLLWSTDSGEDPPADLSECRPSRIIINGRVVELSDIPAETHGRFLGGN